MWDELAGPDGQLVRADCEDADIACRVRAAAREVWYQPMSCVIRYDAIAPRSGKDRAENQKRPDERWREALLSHRSTGADPHLEKDRNVGMRILVIDAQTPTPDRDAGSYFTFNILQVFQRLGCKASFVSVDDVLGVAEYTGNLRRIGIETIQCATILQVADLLAFRGREFDHVLIFRYGVAGPLMSRLRRYCPDSGLIFHPADLHYLRMEREAIITGDAKLAQAAAAVKRRELAVAAAADCIITHSYVEEDVLKRELAAARIVVFPWISDVIGTNVGFGDRRDIMFLGGYRHSPNVDAVTWFVRKIWPLVRAQAPECRFYVVGSDPPAELQALDRQGWNRSDQVRAGPPQLL